MNSWRRSPCFLSPGSVPNRVERSTKRITFAQQYRDSQALYRVIRAVWAIRGGADSTTSPMPADRIVSRIVVTLPRNVASVARPAASLLPPQRITMSGFFTMTSVWIRTSI